jgi:hypothetical protein
MLLTGGLALSAAEASVYDFENFEIFQGIQGVDGWVRLPGTVGFMRVELDDTPENGSKVAVPSLGVDSGWFAYLSRTNNDTFQYSPFFGTETQAVVQFDTTAVASTGFGLGADADGDGFVTPQAGEVGPVFGTYRSQEQGIDQFGVMGANGVSLDVTPLDDVDPCCNAGSDWYRLQLRMDFTANAGAGAGSLYYMNLTRGDSQFQPVAGLQNVNLALDTLVPSAGPEDWNAMWMAARFDGALNVPRLDNLVPRIPAVMQLDGDLSVQGVDGMDTFGAMFDVTLEAVKDPADVTGFYWHLKQFDVPDPNTPASSVLQPDLDLLLDSVDISAVYPGIATLPDVCLEFQGWDEADPTTMTWKYVPDGCQ